VGAGITRLNLRAGAHHGGIEDLCMIPSSAVEQ